MFFSDSLGRLIVRYWPGVLALNLRPWARLTNSLKVMGYIYPVRVQLFRLFFLMRQDNIKFMKGQSYRISDINKIYTELCNQKGNPNISTFKEQLNQISRILVWDDQNNSDLFDYLCEVKMLETLLDIFGSTRDKEVVNAILSFITILLSNLSRQPSVNYLLSHPVMGCLTLTKFGNMNNEIADYYINFLKVLSRKITNNNLHLFFNERYPTFPLLYQTIRFFNHPQNLVRTTCRNIILTLAKLKNPLVDNFMGNFPFATYYVHQSNFLKEYWRIADSIIRKKEDNSYELAHLEQLFQDHEEILIFIDDLLGLQQQGVVTCFVSAFLNQCLSPLIASLDTEAKDCFSIQISIYIVIVLFKTFTHPEVADSLAYIFLSKYHPKKLSESLSEPIPCLLSYDKKWKFKGFWDTQQDRVRLYCSEAFCNYISKKPQLFKNFESQPSGGLSKVDTNSVFGVTNNFYEREIQKVENIFGFSIISNAEQRKIKGGGEYLKQIFECIKQKKGIEIEDCEINSVSGTIQSYLMSKDDTLMLLALTLFSTVFQNRSISAYMLNYCKVSLEPENKDFQSIIKLQKLIINCLKIFTVDPPCYRMCTYLEAFDLIKKLAKFYKINNLSLSPDVLNVLIAGLKLCIDRIVPYLYSGKQWEKVISMYIEVERYGSKKRYKTLKTFGFLPQEDISHGKVDLATDYIFDNFPKEFHHQIARDFWIYFLIKQLYHEFNKIYEFNKLQNFPEKRETYKYEQGKTYKNIDDEVIYVEHRFKAQDKSTPSSLILMTGYFVLLENSVVKKRISYDQFLPLPDRSDPRKLFLSGEGETIWLQLSNASTAQALLLHLQEGRSVLMRFKLSQIVKEVQAIKDWCS